MAKTVIKAMVRIELYATCIFHSGDLLDSFDWWTVIQEKKHPNFRNSPFLNENVSH